MPRCNSVAERIRESTTAYHYAYIFVNSGGKHDFKIDEFNVATKRIKSEEQDVVEFTTDKAGTFEYYCSVGNHRAMGMKGTLTVTE